MKMAKLPLLVVYRFLLRISRHDVTSASLVIRAGDILGLYCYGSIIFEEENIKK